MRISKKRFKAVLCAILSMCIFAYSAYPVFAEEQAAQEASTEQTQATTIDPNDIDAVSYTHLDVYKRQVYRSAVN